MASLCEVDSKDGTRERKRDIAKSAKGALGALIATLSTS